MKALLGKSYSGNVLNEDRADQILACCDLSGVSFRDAHLLRVTFLGCDLSKTSFSGTKMDSCSFINCFSMPGTSVNFLNAQVKNMTEEMSSLSAIGLSPSLFSSRWPLYADSCATRFRSERNDTRYYAIKEARQNLAIGRIVYSYLGVCLFDPEWEIREASLEALVYIRKEVTPFPGFDADMVTWMLTRLGDPCAFVRDTATKLLSIINPSDKELRDVTINVIDDLLLSMRTCYTLLFMNSLYRQLIDVDFIQNTACSSVLIEARLIAIEILERLGEAYYAKILPALVADNASEVRERTLIVLGGSSLPDAGRYVFELANDRNPVVRLQALNTAEEMGIIDIQMLEKAHGDPAPEIRQFASRYK
jgi:hypothetical protein